MDNNKKSCPVDDSYTYEIEELHVIKNQDSTFDITGKVTGVPDNPDGAYKLTSKNLSASYGVRCIRDFKGATIKHTLEMERTALDCIEPNQVLLEIELCENKAQSEFIDMEASHKCLDDALKKGTYTTKDLLDEVSRIWNDGNISEEFKDFLAKAIAGERNKPPVKALNKSDTQSLWEYIHTAPNLVKRMLNAETESESIDIFHDSIKTGEAKLVKEHDVTPEDISNSIYFNLGFLKEAGFDIEYNYRTNKLTVKNMEHLVELHGDSIEETKKIRKEAEDLLAETTNLVEALDDINNKHDSKNSD